MYYFTTCPSPVGALTLACDQEAGAIVGLWIEGQKYHGGAIASMMEERRDLPIFGRAEQWLARYFAGDRPDAASLPLAPIGTPFRQAVWHLLRQIPYGDVVTYGDLARRMAAQMGRASMSSRAIGGAVGHNPISIIIPCHRVVGASGSLTGFSAGTEVKRRLLALEGGNRPMP